jgi:hypothetical protein
MQFKPNVIFCAIDASGNTLYSACVTREELLVQSYTIDLWGDSNRITGGLATAMLETNGEVIGIIPEAWPDSK